MALTIVADDLAGACDTGTLFARRAPVPVTVWPDLPVAEEVAAVDTESRHLARDDATERVRGTVARRPGATSWFKKIDSTLRDHVGAEIVALLEATERPSASASTRSARRCPAGAGWWSRGAAAPQRGASSPRHGRPASACWGRPTEWTRTPARPPQPSPGRLRTCSARNRLIWSR